MKAKDIDYINYTAEDFSMDESFRAYYLSADQEDILFWKRWIKAHPEKREEIEEAIGILNVLISRLPEDEFEDQLKKFSEAALPRQQPIAKHQQMGWAAAWGRMAAAIAFLMVAGLVGYQLSQDFFDTPDTDVQAIRQINKSTNKGQKATFTLQDGTKIHLNAESQITLPEYFEDSIRELSLEGEAYFEVAEDKQRPFIVKCGGLHTKALGTSFTINAYPETKKIKVVLIEGKVQVSKAAAKDSVVLQPSEMALFDKEKFGIKKLNVNTREFTAWKEGVIVFNSAPFEEIQQVLERWYDVSFEYQKPPTMQSFTGEFKHQSLKAVMDGISFSVGFSYRIEGKKVIINS